MNERSIFLAALEIQEPAQRRDYVDQACRDDAELRAAVEGLLRHHSDAGSFLEDPALATTLAVPPLECAGTVIGPYKLLEQIGEGGMGVVYMAEQQQPLRRYVALKIIKPGMDTRQVIARFEAERQALALMDHPNIAKILDAGVIDGGPRGWGLEEGAGGWGLEAGDESAPNPQSAVPNPQSPPAPSLQPPAPSSSRPYFVMELVRGIPITEYCDQAKLPISERLNLFIMVCRAVQHAHQKAIIHRDIKPSNLLVTLHDGTPVPKVIDFGIAKAIGHKLTEHTLHTGLAQMIGTPAYMSPEQAELSGLDIDTRSDIYSLGVLLYELLTGSTPFDRETLSRAGLDEFRRLVREVEPPVPSSRISTLEGDALSTIATRRASEPRKLGQLLRGELDWLVMKSLEKDRNRRYETASAFAADVERYLNHEPVQACPPSAVYRLRKFVRRNKRAVAAATAVLLTLIIGMAGTSWGLIAARQAKRESDRRLEQIENGNEILASIFADMERRADGPDGKPLRDWLVGRLNRAAAVLDSGAVGEPLALARLQHSLGCAYRGLGYAEKAVLLLEQALEARQTRLEADHADTLSSMGALAMALQDAGNSDQALTLYEQTVERTKAKFGADHPETLAATRNLAIGCQAAGKLDRALPIFNELLRLNKATHGADHADTIKSLADLATAYDLAGQREQALPLLEETLRLAKANLPPGHSITIFTTTRLALAYKDAGKLEEASALFAEVLRFVESEGGRAHTFLANLGADHPATLAHAHNLAVVYMETGKIDKALPLFEETLRLRKAKFGADHPATLDTMERFAQAYWVAKKFDRAVPLYEELLRRQEANPGHKHSDILLTLANLAVNYRDAGRMQEAARTAEEYMARYQQAPTGERAGTDWFVPQAAAIFTRGGKPHRAEPILRERVAAAELQFGKASQQAVDERGPLGMCLLEQGKYAEAEPLLREMVDAFQRTFGANHVDVAAARGRLGLALLQQKKFTEAESVFRECLAVREKRQPNQWLTFSTKALLGGSLLGQKKYAEAEPLLLAGYEGMLKRKFSNPRVAQIRQTEALERLVQVYEETKKPTEAAKWREELKKRQTTRGQ